MGLIKFLICALGHPLPFIGYIWILARGSLGNCQEKLCGLPLFYEVSTNFYRVNLKVYIPYAILLYIFWVGFQFWILHAFGGYSLQEFMEIKFSLTYVILCGMGLINLLFWIVGMEENIFESIFALPLLILLMVLLFFEFRIFFMA